MGTDRSSTEFNFCSYTQSQASTALRTFGHFNYRGSDVLLGTVRAGKSGLGDSEKNASECGGDTVGICDSDDHVAYTVCDEHPNPRAASGPTDCSVSGWWRNILWPAGDE